MRRSVAALLFLPVIVGSLALTPLAQQPESAGQAKAPAESVKLAVDLVVVDAQVMQQKTGRVVGDLKQGDFVLSEDGVKQNITHFSQDTLPLSVILLIDRGSCLDPFSEKVHRATNEALSRLRPGDEVALMAFSDEVEMVQGFTYDRKKIATALERLPEHNEDGGHCYNKAFYEAASYMRRAGNPDGRRVIIVISTVTTAFDCGQPSGEEARAAILESGAVVCGIIPKSPLQRMESGAMKAATAMGGLFGLKKTSIIKYAEETGGEILTDKPENLDHVFNNLVAQLRTRYSIGFVSSNAKRDGSFRKLKVELAESPRKREEKLVVKTRRGYVAGRPAGESVKTGVNN
jgi:Ca-activated chloride channel family protein